MGEINLRLGVRYIIHTPVSPPKKGNVGYKFVRLPRLSSVTADGREEAERSHRTSFSIVCSKYCTNEHKLPMMAELPKGPEDLL